MGARGGTWDWQAEKDELFRKYLAKAADARSKAAPRPPLPWGVTRKACRELMRVRVRVLATSRASRSSVAEFELLHRMCDGCKRCSVPPA